MLKMTSFQKYFSTLCVRTTEKHWIIFLNSNIISNSLLVNYLGFFYAQSCNMWTSAWWDVEHTEQQSPKMSTLQPPETCEYGTLHDKTDSVDVSKLRILMWGGFSGLSSWALEESGEGSASKKATWWWKQERQVMTEAEARRMHFEDGRRGHREGMQEAETDKEADSPLKLPEETQPCWYLDFSSTGLILGFFLNLFFNWRKIALQCCVGFCHTMQISHNYTYIPSLLIILNFWSPAL